MRFSSLVAIALLVAATPGMAAEAVVDPDPGQLNPAEIVQKVAGMPARGATKARVREQLGEPQRRIPAVGDPPISQWVYEPFTVYFEYDRVLHSVKKPGEDDR